MTASATPPKGRGRSQSLPKQPKRAQARSARPASSTIAIGTRVVSALWLLLRVAVIAACVALIVAWRAFDVTPMAIVSGSMEPTIPTHSLIFVEEVAPAKIAEGDVITFNPPGLTPCVTHRVVEREQINGQWFFTTQGDANDAVDDWRTPEQIERGVTTRGVTYEDRQALRHVWGVPHLGHIVKLTEHTKLRMALVFGSLAAILLLLLARIWRDDADGVEDVDVDVNGTAEVSSR